MTVSRIATRYWGQLWRQGMRSAHWLNQQTQGWLGMLAGAVEQAIKPESGITAAAIAYFALFALFPFTLLSIAHRAMRERGLLPDFSAVALAELGQALAAPVIDGETVRDLRELLWVSIDNDDSLDLDQLTSAEALPSDKVKIRVAVADVDALVKDGSAIDDHARHNTTSVYTAAMIFPMLPERLSTDLTP